MFSYYRHDLLPIPQHGVQLPRTCLSTYRVRHHTWTKTSRCLLPIPTYSRGKLPPPLICPAQGPVNFDACVSHFPLFRLPEITPLHHVHCGPHLLCSHRSPLFQSNHPLLCLLAHRIDSSTSDHWYFFHNRRPNLRSPTCSAMSSRALTYLLSKAPTVFDVSFLVTTPRLLASDPQYMRTRFTGFFLSPRTSFA